METFLDRFSWNYFVPQFQEGWKILTCEQSSSLIRKKIFNHKWTSISLVCGTLWQVSSNELIVSYYRFYEKVLTTKEEVLEGYWFLIDYD